MNHKNFFLVFTIFLFHYCILPVKYREKIINVFSIKYSKYQSGVRIKSSFFTNILSVGDKEITNCPCTIHINNEHEIEMPLLVALSSFASVSRDLMSDATLRDFNIIVDFTNEVSSAFYTKFTKILEGYEVTLSEDEVVNLAQIGVIANNHYFIEPLEAQFQSIERTLTLDNVFTLLSQKRKFGIKAENCTIEISLIAKNFETEKEKIRKLAEDVTFVDIIVNIISNEHLQLKNEDSLLRFVIELCSIDATYEALFQYVWLEYCSIDVIREFITYVDSHIDTTRNNRSIFECMKRRLLEPKLQKSQNFSEERHEDNSMDNKLNEEVEVYDPLVLDDMYGDF